MRSESRGSSRRIRVWQRDSSPRRAFPNRIPGPAGPPIHREACLRTRRQEAASEASGPGLPDRTAPQEALVNSASMVLLHDQGYGPDPSKEPHVPPPPRAAHHDQPPKWRCYASRIQPPSAPRPLAASSAPTSEPRQVFARGGQTGAHLRSGTDGERCCDGAQAGIEPDSREERDVETLSPREHFPASAASTLSRVPDSTPLSTTRTCNTVADVYQ